MDIHDDHPDLIDLARNGRVVAYFGYGSLVNKHTLRTRFLGIRRARVEGWRRLWLPRTENEDSAVLSVERAEGHAIEGVVVYDHADHLPAVDEREAGYDRRIVDLTRLRIENPPVGDVPIHIYEALRGTPNAEETRAAILQSYLDAVMQGFRMLYGDEGARRFVTETEGFETDILCDRLSPRYPRPVALEQGEAAFFDGLVMQRGARLVAPDRETIGQGS